MAKLPSTWSVASRAVARSKTMSSGLQPSLGVQNPHQRGVNRKGAAKRLQLRIGRARPDALVVVADRFLLAHRKEIVAFAATNRLPGMYAYQQFVNAGGLLSYASNDID